MKCNRPSLLGNLSLPSTFEKTVSAVCTEHRIFDVLFDFLQIMCQKSSHTFSLSALTLACLLALPQFSVAADNGTAAGTDESVHKLQTLRVTSALEENGKVVLDREDIESAPTSTNTISDLLRGESFVQFDANSRDGCRGGEITPPQLSIRGSRNYENNFMINGLSNNNPISPSGWDTTGANGGYGVFPKGDAQAVMITPDLLESVTVLSENVSAEYGDFMGGVVDARIRDAKTDRWHVKAWVRHTRDAWTRQHFVPGSIEETEDQPTGIQGIQKQFKRTESGLVFEGPLMDGKLGAMLSYQNTHSSVPVWTDYVSTKERHNTSRDNDNFMIRLNTDPNNDFYASATLAYAPYEADLYAQTNRNGAYSQEGGGWNFMLNTRAKLSIGTLTTDFGYINSDVSLNASNNKQYQWLTHANGQPSSHANWGAGTYGKLNEGLMGDFEQTLESYNLKSTMAFHAFDLGMTKNEIRTGVDLQWKKAKSAAEGYEMWFVPMASPIVKGDMANGVIEGEQYAMMKSVGPSFNRSVDTFAAAAFLEDTISVERFTFRPGVRASYDDVTDDVNFAPRFVMNVDLLNDKRFDVNAGYNRYYGSQILSHALAAKAWAINYTRSLKSDGSGELTDWTTASPDVVFNEYKDLGNLKTPYSDEFVLGASANVFDSVFKIQAVKREYRDQLRTMKSTRPGYTHEMTNTGSTDYEGITFSFEKAFDLGKWGVHSSELGITWSKLEGNSTNWLASWEEGDPVSGRGINRDFIILDGQKTAVADMPAGNFNADWVINYTHRAAFMEDRLRSTLWLRWESEADRIYNTGDTETIGSEQFRIFKTGENEDLFNADFNLAYDLVKTMNSTLTVNMDVMNLFDNKNLVLTDAANGVGRYSMGRQFFLGLTYEY